MGVSKIISSKVVSTFATRLRELRGAESQASFSSALGIHRIQYAKYEAGKNVPSIEVLERICRVHACSADWLLGLKDRGTSVRADKGSMAVNISNNRLNGSIGPFSITSDPPPNCKKCPHLKKLKALEELMAK